MAMLLLQIAVNLLGDSVCCCRVVFFHSFDSSTLVLEVDNKAKYKCQQILVIQSECVCVRFSYLYA